LSGLDVNNVTNNGPVLN